MEIRPSGPAFEKSSGRVGKGERGLSFIETRTGYGKTVIPNLAPRERKKKKHKNTTSTEIVPNSFFIAAQSTTLPLGRHAHKHVVDPERRLH
jgi:hypothetical protein